MMQGELNSTQWRLRARLALAPLVAILLSTPNALAAGECIAPAPQPPALGWTTAQYLVQAISLCQSRFNESFRGSFVSAIEFLEGSVANPSLILTPAELAELTGAIDATYEDMQRLQSSLGALVSSLGGSEGAPADKILPVPDPQLRFGAAKLLKMADDSPAFRANDPRYNTPEKAVREYLAESFERMARIFVAGSDQLQRDFPGTYSGPRIRGLYEGRQPDLMNASSSGRIVESAFDPQWGSCNSGVANSQNGIKQWFKSPDGQYRGEVVSGGSLTSHRCAGTPVIGRSEFPVARGQIVQMYLMLMERIAADLRAGKVVAASAFPGFPDSCSARMVVDIDLYRQRLRAIRNDPRTGIESTDVQGTDCGDLEGYQDAQSRIDAINTENKLTQNQIRTCIMAKQQTDIEVRMVLKYSYCTWRAMGDEMRRKMTDALLRGGS